MSEKRQDIQANRLGDRYLANLASCLEVYIDNAETFFRKFPEITIDDLNKIEFDFAQFGEPFLTSNYIGGKVLTTGFAQIMFSAANYPLSISDSLKSMLGSQFFIGLPISFPIQAEIQVCKSEIDNCIILPQCSILSINASFIESRELTGAYIYLFLTINFDLSISIQKAEGRG